MDVIEAVRALGEGINRVAGMYEKGEVFMPEVLLSSDVMYAAFNILKPHVKPGEGRAKKIVIGTVEGDVHDIGKNILKAILAAAGFEVVDPGRDVPVEKFVSAVMENGADALQ